MNQNADIEKKFAAAFLEAMHAFHNLAGKVIKTGEIPLAQYRLLMLLQAKGPMTIKQLTQRLGVAQSTASELCVRTMEAGYIIKQQDNADRRRTLYKLSPKAVALMKKRRRQMNKIYRTALEGLDTAEQQELIKAFETISRLLDFE